MTGVPVPTSANPLNAFPFFWPMPPMPLAAATENLSQSILPGWNFGPITINDQNSGSPSAELEIVAAASYGRQLGKLMDAVCLLIERDGHNDDADLPPPLADLLALRDRVEAIKTDTAKRRVQQVARDLRDVLRDVS
jgi:hypothetical protein